MSSVTSEKKTFSGPYMQQLDQLIKLQKNEIIKKALDKFLAKDFQGASDFLLNSFPESSFNEDCSALTLMGHIQTRMGDYDSAIDYFKKALRKDPTEIYFLNDSLGMIYFLKKEFNTAVKYFKEAKNYAQNNYHYHFHVGLCYESILQTKLLDLNQNEDDNEKQQAIQAIKDKIKESYEEALNINPNSYHVLLNLGSFNGREGLHSVAEKMFKKAVAYCDGDWKIYANLAYLGLMEKEYKLSCEYFDKTFSILDINEAELRILLPYMIALHKSDNYIKLEKVTKLVLKLDKKNKKALIYLIDALKHNKKYGELINVCKKIRKKLKQVVIDKEIDIHDLNTEIAVHYDKVRKKINSILKEAKKSLKFAENNKDAKRTLQKLGDLSDLARLDSDNVESFGFNEEEIQRIVELYKSDKNNQEALFFLGMINFKEQDFDKAFKFFNTLYNINPNYEKALLHECLGDITLGKGDPEKAIEYYKVSYETNSQNEILNLKIGVAYEANKDYDKALEHFKKAYEINNDFTGAIFHIGLVYNIQNNPEALTWYEMAYEKEKENVKFLKGYGEALINTNEEKNINKGILILEKGLEFFTGNVEIICALAKGYEKQNKLKEAIHLLETVSNDQTFSKSKSKMFQLASYYEKAKNLTKAISYFKLVLELDKNNVESLLHMGYIYKSSKEFVKAYKCFNYIIEIDPNNIFAHYGLGRILQLSYMKDNEAIENYKKCVEINPKYPKPIIQLGVIYLRLKKYDDALNYFNQAYALNEKELLCITGIGNAYIEQKNYEKAEEFFKKGLAISKKDISLYAGLGDVYMGLNKIDDAIQKYSEGIKVDPSIPEIHFNLGHCYYIKDKFDQAIAEYTEALKLVENTRHDYYYYLGQALLAGGKIKDSIKAFQAAIKLKNNKWIYYFEIGKALYLDKVFTHAIKYLQTLADTMSKMSDEDKSKICNENEVLYLLFQCYISLPSFDVPKCKNIISSLIEKDKNNIKYLDCLASLNEKTNQTQEAIAVYKNILKIDPKNVEAKNNLQRLELQEDMGKSYHNNKKKKKQQAESQSESDN